MSFVFQVNLERFTNIDQLKEIMTKIEEKVKRGWHTVVSVTKVLPPCKDIRIRKDNPDLKKVMDSIKMFNLLPMNAIIVTPEGSLLRTVDGWTRIQGAVEAGIKTIPVFVVPDLTFEEQIIININNNMKRNPPRELELKSFLEQLVTQFTIPQLAILTGYSETEVKRCLGLNVFPKEIIEMIAETEHLKPSNPKKLTQQKLEVSALGAYKAENVPKKVKDEIEINVAKIITKTGQQRDTMRARKVAQRLKKTTEQLWKLKAPEEIAESVFLKTGESDWTLEHPDKIEAFKRVIETIKPEFVVLLFAEPPFLVPSNSDEFHPTETMVAFKAVGTELLAVSNFENIKIKDVKKYKIKHYRGDVFEFLIKAKPDIRKGLIYLNSCGTPEFYTQQFLEFLMKKYPNSFIAFLAQDQFKNPRNGRLAVIKSSIIHWGFKKVPKSLEHFRVFAESKLNKKITFEWKESNQQGQPLAMLLIHP